MKSGRHFFRLFAASAVSGLLVSGGLAQELVYQPVNPSFGGDSFNSSHLLAIANAQNNYRDPDRPQTTNSQVDQFIRQLQSRLLSSLAAQVNDAIFGQNPQESGVITFGDQTISFFRGLTSVQLTITDHATGAVTQIEIPLLGGSLSGSAESILSTALGGGVLTGSSTAPPPLSDGAGDLGITDPAPDELGNLLPGIF